MKKYIYQLINKLGYRIENKQNFLYKELEYLSKFDVKDENELLFSSRKFIKKINQHYPNLKIKNHLNGFILSLSDIEIYIESTEEIFIICEVFVEKDYNFVIKSKCIVLDVGANIGIASLFFSTIKYVEKIYSFEPVLDTIEQARINFSLNEKICKVSEIYNFGLGKNDREETFIFNKNIKGNTGVRGILSSSYANISQDVSEVNVKIKNVSNVFLDIKNNNPHKKIIVKMDCEGAEYEIFVNLAETGVINHVDVFMIEWHDKGAKIIEDILFNNDFSCFSRNLEINSGMIYAYKNN